MLTNDYCAFSSTHKCIKHTDYELAKYALAEAEELCHENWMELQKKEKYIEVLKELLTKNKISYPDEPL